MTVRRSILNGLNSVLRGANLRIDTLTAEIGKQRRLSAANARGAFTKPVYPVPKCFLSSQHERILSSLQGFTGTFDSLADASRNAVEFEFGNHYFSSPDAEVLYAVVRTFCPATIVELGCGNSTRIARLAIRDGALPTRLHCVDPFPRRDVVAYADELKRVPVEESDIVHTVAKLCPDDILFIDTSHDVRPANDCAYIYGVLLPAIPTGVIVHIHDVFLPFDYPVRLAFGDGATWGEQTIVSVMLQDTDAWEAIWPGYYLQRTLPNFARHFPHLKDGSAQSLWLRKR